MRAQISRRQWRARARADHHVRGRLPRPHAGDARGRRTEEVLEGFGPVAEGFDQVPFGDLAAVKRAIGPTTAAILIEPIQGEGGGVHVVDNQFLRELRELCDTNGLLLVLDEVQTGMGRTGDLFAFQHTGVTPDIMALAKALGGGFPMGALLTTAAAGKDMTAGTHGSTFGGNPLAMAAGNATLDVMLAPGFFDKMRRNALLLKQRLAEIKDRHSAVIAEIRGEGYLVGLRAMVPNGRLVDALRAEKVLAVAAGDNVRSSARPRSARRSPGSTAPPPRSNTRPRKHRWRRRPPDECRRDPSLPRPDRHSAARAERHHRGEPRQEEARARPRRKTARWR
jgi:hypothetical protein